MQVFCQDDVTLKRFCVYRQPLIPVVSRAFSSQFSIPETIDECFDIPLVDYSAPYSAFNAWVNRNDPRLYNKALKKVRRCTASNNVVLKQLVVQGLGMGFLHQEAIEDEIKRGELIPVLTKRGLSLINVEIDLVHKRKQSLGYIQHQFIEFMHKEKANWYCENH